MAAPTTLPANVTAHPDADEVRITRAKLASLLEEGAERVRSAMRGAKTAALDAQANAHKAEMERLHLLFAAEKVEAQKDAHAHGFHKAAWMVGLPAFVLGLVMAGLFAGWMLSAGTESTVRGAAAGSMIRAQQDVERGIDGLTDTTIQDEDAARARGER